MFTEMDTRGPEVDNKDILHLEAFLKTPVPDDYKQFLTDFNGGEPVECAINFEAKELQKNGDTVSTFYEVSEDISYGIQSNMENHSDLIPNGLIFIASTPAGNYFLLSLREDSYGFIYYKDHEINDSIGMDVSNDQLPESMAFISENFSGFLNLLYDPDE